MLLVYSTLAKQFILPFCVVITGFVGGFVGASVAKTYNYILGFILVCLQFIILISTVREIYFLFVQRNSFV